MCTYALLVLCAVLGTFFMSIPLSAEASFPFGGQINKFYACYNSALWAQISAPTPGKFIWTPSTRTYQFGPPRHVGQWLLGNAGNPYFCIYSIQPLAVEPGTHILMMGSSQ